MKQEYFGFGLVILALVGGLFLAKYAGNTIDIPHQPELGSVQLNALSIESAWVAETIAGQNRTAAYFTIHNGSGGEVRLMGISSQIAAHVSIHQTRTVDNISSMQSVDALILQPGTSLQFAPGGYHIMIMGLEAPLVAGGSIILTVDFLEAGTASFEVPVRSRMEMMDHGGH